MSYKFILKTYIDIIKRDEDEDWSFEIEGFLGIVDILGVQHLMVIIAK